MKTIFLMTLGLFILLNAPTKAQGHKHQEKIKSAKIGFITEKLSLSSQQATQFWPVYNKFEDDKTTLRLKMRALHKSLENTDQHTDAELLQLLNQLHSHHKKMATLNEQYHLQFKEILTVKQLALLFLSEHEFKRFLLRKLGDGGGHRGAPPMMD